MEYRDGMRHKFRLAQLLKYRKSIEDQRRVALAMIEEKRYSEEEKLFRLREAQRSWSIELRAKSIEQRAESKKLYALCPMPYALSCLAALSQESFSRRKTLHELQRKILKAKEELLEASKSRKIVEKLRDRDLERLKQSILKQERRHLDEIATGRFIRKLISLS